MYIAFYVSMILDILGTAIFKNVIPWMYAVFYLNYIYSIYLKIKR